VSKTVVCGYVPGPQFKGSTAFMENISRNKIVGDYFFMSDHHAYGFSGAQLAYPPELHEAVLARKQEKGTTAPCISNLVFIFCLARASREGYTHMLYVESDCRFKGNGWDAIMFEEFFSQPFPALAGGSVTAHSMINGGGEFYRRFTQYFKEKQKNLPLPVFGIQVASFRDAKNAFQEGAPQIISPGDFRAELFPIKPSIYPNGAIGIYDVGMLREIFGMNPDGTFKPDYNAVKVVSWPAWDYMIGIALYERFGLEVFDVVAHLETCWSSYGDSLTTEDERLQMLRSGVVRGIHQVKSEVAE
jgi:hypothetical protein